MGPTLREIIHARGLADPEGVAFVFLADGEQDEIRLTYAELDERARVLTARVRAVASRGDHVLLLAPPGLEFIVAFVACLYANVVAVPAYPPTTRRGLARLTAIARDADAAVAIATPVLRPALTGMRVIDVDDGPDPVPEPWPDEAAEPGELALLQYTSGSTSTPRGVMVPHSGLIRNQVLIERAFGTSARSVIVSWLPFYHDMGLIGNLLHPLYVGASCVLLSPLHFLQRPARWLEAISRHGGTISGGPNFGFDLCVDRVEPQARARLDLSTWSVAYTGAEPIRPGTLDRFADRFAPSGFTRDAFRPCYGLAEATLLVSAAPGAPVTREYQVDRLLATGFAEPVSEDSGRRLVSSGRPRVGRLAIVGPDRRELSEHQVGEIWLADACVGSGYWRRDQLTRETFHASLADGAGPFLRTGDLGFLADGELFITGRIKDVIIIRGRNYAPQDLEQTAQESHPALRRGCTAAFSVVADGEERLVIAQELKRSFVADANTAHASTAHASIVHAIRDSVSTEHQLRVHAVALLEPGGIPKTSSSKVQRQACRRAFLEETLPALLVDVAGTHEAGTHRAGEEVARLTRETLLSAPAGQRAPLLEAHLTQRLARVLEVDAVLVTRDLPLTSLGIDSVRALSLQHELEAELGITVPVSALLARATVTSVSAMALAGLTATPAAAAAPGVPARTDHPLSHGQEGLWFLHQLNPDSTVYTVGCGFRSAAPVGVGELTSAISTLVARHATLRTRYTATPGGPVQHIDSTAPVPLTVVDASSLRAAEVEQRVHAELARPFDLEAGPVFRATLLRGAVTGDVVVLAAHHIATDFWGVSILLEELGCLLAGERLTPPGPSYLEHIYAQRALIASPDGDRLAHYWQEQVAGLAPVELPPVATRSPDGSTVTGSYPPRLRQELAAVARDRGVTLYTLLLTAYAVLLHRYTGQEDLAVGTPFAARPSARLRRVVGYFANALPLRIDLSGDPHFADLLSRVQRTVLDALNHEAYPLALIVQRSHAARDPRRPAHFNAFFTLQRAEPWGGDALSALAVRQHSGSLRVGPLTLDPLLQPDEATQFDLDLSVAEAGETIAALLRYRTRVLPPAAARRLLAHYQVLLEGVIEDPARPISALPLLTADERQRLTPAPGTFARDIRIHELFEESALRAPRAPALIQNDRVMSFAELDAAATQLAAFLKGV